MKTQEINGYKVMGWRTGEEMMGWGVMRSLPGTCYISNVNEYRNQALTFKMQEEEFEVAGLKHVEWF